MTPSKKSFSKKNIENHPMFFRLVMFTFLIVLALSIGVNIRFILDEINTPNDAVFANIEALYKKDNRVGSTHDNTIEVNGIIWKKVGPIVATKIVIDSRCETCVDISKEDFLKEVLPFSKIEVIDIAKKNAPPSVKAVPTIVLNKNIEEVQEFSRIQPYLTKNEDNYELNPQAIGINTNKVVVDPALIAQSEQEGQIVIEEYSEFACPYCKKFATETAPLIKEAYGDQVKFDFRHFIVHEEVATPPALASECAQQIAGDEAFWQMHDLLFTEQDFAAEKIQEYARTTGVAGAEFNACLNNEETLSIIKADTLAGRNIGINGTPSFLINDTLVIGAQPFDVFKSIIDSKLK